MNITNDFDTLVKVKDSYAESEGNVLDNKKLIQPLKIALESGKPPFPDKISATQQTFSKESVTSGNLFNLWRLDENRLAILMIEADVNMVEAAKLSIYLRGMFLKEAARNASPAEVVKALESYFWKYLDTEPEMTSTNERVSVFYGVLNVNNGALIYTNAGFLHPMICRKDKQEAYPLENTGLYFGRMDEFFEEETTTLEKGDKLSIASTSFMEIANEKGELFGKTKLDVILKENVHHPAKKVCQIIAEAAKEHSSELSDRDLRAFVISFLLQLFSFSALPFWRLLREEAQRVLPLEQ